MLRVDGEVGFGTHAVRKKTRGRRAADQLARGGRNPGVVHLYISKGPHYRCVHFTRVKRGAVPKVTGLQQQMILTRSGG